MAKVKLTAIKDVRIRLDDGEKHDITEGATVEIDDSRLYYFLTNGFVKAEHKVKKGEIQTTDASDDETVSNKGKKKISK